MGSNTLSRHLVHLFSTDLDLHLLTIGANDSGVETLVHVCLGETYVVFESPRYRLPERMDNSKGLVTLLLCLQNDPKGYEVVYLV